MWNPWHVFTSGKVGRLQGNYLLNGRTFKLKRQAVAAGKKLAAKLEREGRKKFPVELALMMDKAHRLGLHETGHALHTAVQKVGWELAQRRST